MTDTGRTYHATPRMQSIKPVARAASKLLRRVMFSPYGEAYVHYSPTGDGKWNQEGRMLVLRHHVWKSAETIDPARCAAEALLFGCGSVEVTPFAEDSDRSMAFGGDS